MMHYANILRLEDLSFLFCTHGSREGEKFIQDLFHDVIHRERDCIWLREKLHNEGKAQRQKRRVSTSTQVSALVGAAAVQVH
jgi:hypothetical protein